VYALITYIFFSLSSFAKINIFYLFEMARRSRKKKLYREREKKKLIIIPIIIKSNIKFHKAEKRREVVFK
jgi:hypothetical protein